MEPWYVSMFLTGISIGGILPILLPFVVAARLGTPSAVAYVMATFSLGQIVAPLLGRFADESGQHKSLFVLTLIVMALSVALLAVAQSDWAFVGWAGIAGITASGTSTLSNLLIVEFHSRTEWEPRIGWLQTANGAGQVLGLVLAAFLVVHSVAGFLVAACLIALAVPFLLLGAARPNPAKTRRAIDGEMIAATVREIDIRLVARFAHKEQVGDGILRSSYHHLQAAWDYVRRRGLKTPFGTFVLSWFVWIFGGSAFFAYLPLLFRDGFGVSPRAISMVFAVSAAISLFLFPLAASACRRFGPTLIYRAGMLLRALGYVTVGLAMMVHGAADYGVAGFAVLAACWPLLIVSGSDLTAHLGATEEGAAFGVFNAAAAVAGVVGTLAGAPVMEYFGYAGLVWLGVGGLLAALMIAGAAPVVRVEPDMETVR